jgi:hypothetical protein
VRPAYISTLAPVIRPTRECQLGNGSKKNSPMMNAVIRLLVTRMHARPGHKWVPPGKLAVTSLLFSL